MKKLTLLVLLLMVVCLTAPLSFAKTETGNKKQAVQLPAAPVIVKLDGNNSTAVFVQLDGFNDSIIGYKRYSIPYNGNERMLDPKWLKENGIIFSERTNPESIGGNTTGTIVKTAVEYDENAKGVAFMFTFIDKNMNESEPSKVRVGFKPYKPQAE